MADMISDEWREDSLRWRGKVLTGQHGHWCPDWDYLPIDETCPEWPCPCSASDGWHGPVADFEQLARTTLPEER